MIEENIQVKTNNGHQLYVHCWKPKSEIKAAITLVHGFGENCIRYTPYLQAFIDNNIAILSFDHYGHGQSEGKRGVIVSYDTMLDDIEICVNKTKELFPGLPNFIYGHSMGGNLVFNLVLRRNTKVSGVILTSPWLTLTKQPNVLLKKAVSALAKIAPKVTINSNLNACDISSLELEVEKYLNDPLNHDRISFQLLNSIIKSGLWAIDNADKVQIPTIIHHGTADKITSPQSSKTASKKSDLIEFVEWEGGFHELHNDFCREEISASLIKWIKNQI